MTFAIMNQIKNMDKFLPSILGGFTSLADKYDGLSVNTNKQGIPAGIKVSPAGLSLIHI